MKMFAGVVAILVAAPLFVSVQTTHAADARDTKAPAWKQDAGVHDTKDIIGTRIKNTADFAIAGRRLARHRTNVPLMDRAATGCIGGGGAYSRG